MPPMQLQGAIVRAGKMSKTVTMAVAKDVYLSKLQKTVTKHKKYLIHDEQNQLLVGDHVIAEACPPLSARKRFRFVELVGGVDAGSARRLRSQQLMAAEDRERVRIEAIVRAETQAAAGKGNSANAKHVPRGRRGSGKEGPAGKKGLLAQARRRMAAEGTPEVVQGNAPAASASSSSQDGGSQQQQ
ncbi:hypothetical protein CF319_g5215 [Tilletia indica]|uniref:Uncharacterized protein n=1 Tax=Tilletia indica TaxID=43049 RepID=A0A177TSH3_9BASI|nr:hypothetical protein CF319_g5215 [Tilletia indica]KAE8260190.1 hypothetical protein A4X13_0g494 [Tilletia indica]